jgi:hypothetical protein
LDFLRRFLPFARGIPSHDVSFLQTDRRFPGEPCFHGLKAIAMAEADVERGSKTSRERRFYLSSLPLNAALFAHAFRSHWAIESVPQTHTGKEFTVN